MLLVRLAKIAMITALAAFATIVAYDNIVDYDSNYQFIGHVLSMDTTFPGNALMHRAITNKNVWNAAYALIIATEGLVGLLLAIGALLLLLRVTARAERFNRVKVCAIAGMTLGFGLWFFGFLVIAGEYFAMWQSKIWNGQEGAFRVIMVARNNVPAIAFTPQFGKDGGLMAYNSVITDQFRGAAGYVGRILHGEKPSDLPVQMPAKFSMIINLKTAKAFGLNISPGLLATADEVIE